MNSKDKETAEWLYTLAAGHMVGIAGNPNDAAALDTYQRLITLKGASNGR